MHVVTSLTEVIREQSRLLPVFGWTAQRGPDSVKHGLIATLSSCELSADSDETEHIHPK